MRGVKRKIKGNIILRNLFIKKQKVVVEENISLFDCVVVFKMKYNWVCLWVEVIEQSRMKVSK